VVVRRGDFARSNYQAHRGANGRGGVAKFDQAWHNRTAACGRIPCAQARTRVPFHGGSIGGCCLWALKALFNLRSVDDDSSSHMMRYLVRRIWQMGLAAAAAVSPRWLHRHQPVATARAGRRLLQQARDVRAVDEGRQERNKVDTAVMLLVCPQRRAALASCAGL
jgi:hypothetical protein